MITISLPVSGEFVHKVYKNLLFAEKIRYFIEKLFESPHFLWIDFQQTGKNWCEMFLDSLTEEAGVRKFSAPLNGSILCRLSPADDSAGLLGGDVVHRLFITSSTERTEWKIA